VIFTSNATAGMKLVAENFRWSGSQVSVLQTFYALTFHCKVSEFIMNMLHGSMHAVMDTTVSYATVVRYMHKMFMTLATGFNILKLISLLLTLSQNKLVFFSSEGL
jgi:hypothetical protein